MWHIETMDTFDEWYDGLTDSDRTNVLAAIMVLRERGPRCFLGPMRTLSMDRSTAT